MQVVWPDRAGVFPWEDGCRDTCRDNQPATWQAADDGQPGLWGHLDQILPWPFEDAGVHTFVRASKSVVSGRSPVTFVRHDAEGSWQFLSSATDGDADGDADLAHLHHLLADHPRIREVAGLQPGEEAELTGAGDWRRRRR